MESPDPDRRLEVLRRLARVGLTVGMLALLVVLGVAVYVFVVGQRSSNAVDQGCRGLTCYITEIQLPYGATVSEAEVCHGENVTFRRRS